jgi:type II secretory pathway predicted ATPase ExeA
MYKNYFGFSESPFNIAPNSRFYHRTPSCDEALGIVRYGIATRKGIVVVVGEPGTGKTLLIKSLTRALDPTEKAVVMQNPHTDFAGILRFLLDRLDLHVPGDDITTSLDRLTDHLIERRRDGHTICLVIDEAQDLDPVTLDQLRILANLDFEAEALLPIILLGQLELKFKLDQPSAVRLKQRVALTRHIYPLIRKEVGSYIASRVEAAGCDKTGLFEPEAIEKIAAYSRGIPRMVNSICDNSLILAYITNQALISPQIVDQVARELRITAPVVLEKQPVRPSSDRDASKDNAQAGTAQVTAGPDDEQPVESGDMAKQGATIIEPPDSNDATLYGLEPHVNPVSPPIHPSRDFTEAPKSAPGSWEDTAGATPFLTGTEMTHNLLRVRLRWYAVAAAGGLLLLFVSIVGSYQLAGIYSTASSVKQAMFAEKPIPSPQAPTLSGRVTNGHWAAPVTPEPVALEPERSAIAISEPVQEAKSRGAPEEAVAAAPLPESDSRQPQPTGASERNTSGNKPAPQTLKVTGLSTVRATPSDRAEIIGELEPGSKVRILAKSRDYYHVRSMDKKPLRGYVHREDAFFEK